MLIFDKTFHSFSSVRKNMTTVDHSHCGRTFVVDCWRCSLEVQGTVYSVKLLSTPLTNGLHKTVIYEIFKPV